MRHEECDFTAKALRREEKSHTATLCITISRFSGINPNKNI